MKSRFLIVVLAVFLIFSCDHFVNLGDKSLGDADYTEGLPDEIYEGENSDSADAGNYDDWNEDSGADTDAEENGADGGAPAAEPTDSWNDDDLPEADSDSNDDAEFPGEEGEVYVFPESDPFPEGFSNAGCGCGGTPDYLPVCCDGKISVFNACFANCYAVNSGNKICVSYENGLCGEAAGITRDPDEEGGDQEPADDEDAETDDDTELPDEDAGPAVISNECGCYPEDEPSIFSCADNSFYFITECLATCHCENPQKLFL